MADIDEIALIEDKIAQHQEAIRKLQEQREQVTTIQVKRYLHAGNDEYQEWEIDDDGNLRWDQEVHGNIHYSLYEVEFDVEYDLTTGEDRIIQVKYGDQILVPKEND